MKPSEICTRAIDLLETHGWTTGTYRERDGRLCLIGACRAAALHLTAPPITPDVATEYISVDFMYPNEYYQALNELHTVAHTTNLAQWNDTRAKTQDRVIGVLHTAATNLHRTGR
jgi:hypothetical protein